MIIFDCIILGAGPAGLSASLNLGRMRRNVAIFDNGTNRNRVTHESHGFITRDGTTPAEFRNIGLNELTKYPSVTYFNRTITEVSRDEQAGIFVIETAENEKYTAEKIVMATGIQEEFPIEAVRNFYGRSIFSCPYCDGWELRDKPLFVIANKEEQVLHMAKLLYSISRDLYIVTNGTQLSADCIRELEKHDMRYNMEPVQALHGDNGNLEAIEFRTGEKVTRSFGFVVPSFHRANPFAEKLGCNIAETGSVITDGMGRTSQSGIYIAGETQKAGPSSLLIAAAEGNIVAGSVNMDIATEKF
ncbi:thioredoxin reductase [Listeria weihenstephanensis FSL R9-0317]|uniref:NAD(P)/FAD-dependent oxidoreductase n=1 Tax=Listeria weihenstephanensis TaxID=1006155 RepID=UPI0003E8BD41|nr:NAD(P)/FAD-dependent oxidoreductase [Listeria weihenstephanensis]EUJ36254.1 thioredoxin reductase [Listeria weihenstephanensis FSL R9-0317]